jgi:hypothetical protein
MIRRLLILLAMLAVTALAGCGPGVGGTGTGEAAARGPADFGATPAPVCTSDLAPTLACAATGTPGPAAAQVPTATRWDSQAPGTPAEARFEAQALRLDARCAGLVFRGSWGVDAGGQGRYFGDVRAAASGAPQAAQVLVSTPATGSVSLTLFDADAHVLLGPLTLAPVPADAATRACP